MRRAWLLLALALAPLAQAAPGLAGRWEGTIDIPGAPQAIVIDVAPVAAGWAGSFTLPGRGVKGAPLRDLQADDRHLAASVAAAFGQPMEPAPRLALARRPDGALAGTWQMNGLVAPAVLHRTGDAQVDMPPAGTAVSPALAGTWTGRYELGGVPREVTLKVGNGPQGVATGELRIVGKRTTTLPVDRVVQGREYVSFESTAMGFRIEGRWQTPDGSIQGQVAQGPFEAPLVLRRAPGGAS
jgi:hypothetical protein